MSISIQWISSLIIIEIQHSRLVQETHTIWEKKVSIFFIFFRILIQFLKGDDKKSLSWLLPSNAIDFQEFSYLCFKARNFQEICIFIIKGKKARNLHIQDTEYKIRKKNSWLRARIFFLFNIAIPCYRFF